MSVALALTNLPICISIPAHRQGPKAKVPMPPSPASRREKVPRVPEHKQSTRKVATPPPPPVSPILVESSPSPETQTQQVPSPSQPQGTPQVEELHPEEPQPEVPQPEDTSADMGEQATDPAGLIISSVVSSIQTSASSPQGNTLLMKSLPMNSSLPSYNYFCYSFS